MAQRSRIERELSAADKAAFDRLLAEGRLTLDGLVAWLGERDYEISRSSVHRYADRYQAAAAKLRESREIASAFGRELGDMADNDMGRVLIEMLHGIVFKMLLTEAEGEQPTMESMDVMLLAKAIKDAAGTMKTNVDLQTKLRLEAQREAAKAAEAVVAERGLSEELAAAIRQKIFGASG